MTGVFFFSSVTKNSTLALAIQVCLVEPVKPWQLVGSFHPSLQVSREDRTSSLSACYSEIFKFDQINSFSLLIASWCAYLTFSPQNLISAYEDINQRGVRKGSFFPRWMDWMQWPGWEVLRGPWERKCAPLRNCGLPFLCIFAPISPSPRELCRLSSLPPAFKEINFPLFPHCPD